MSGRATHEATVIEAEPARPVEGQEQAERPVVAPREVRRTYRRRFAAVYLALALVAGAGIGAFIVLVTNPDARPAPAWSAWEPTGSNDARTKQIADRVSHAYKLPSGSQLAVAIASPPKVAGGAEGDIGVAAIAIRPDTSRGLAEEDDVELVTDARDSSVQYVLCGLGESCSIPEGSPSEARHALLRRQALELSLYTFKYVDGIDSVTVFLPPRPATPEDTQAPLPTAVFLERSDVGPELSRPLVRTLPGQVPGLGAMKPAELATVNRITRARLYTPEYTQAQDGSAILVLSPVLNT